MLSKKVFALFLVVCFISALIMGCAAKTGDSTVATTKERQQQSVESTIAEEQKEIPKVYIYQNCGKVQAESKAGSNPDDLEAVKQYVIEKTGIEPVPIIPSAKDSADKLNLLLASGEQVDVFWGNWRDYQAKNAIIPINDLLTQYGKDVKEGWNQDVWDVMTDKDGQIWGFPRVGYESGMNPVFIRQDWLDKLELKLPTNFDEFEVILKAFKENNPNGSGDTIPLITNVNGVKYALSAGFLDFGYGNWQDVDGKVKPAELNPGFKECLARLAEWYKKGYIFKEAFSTDRARYNELVKQNKVGSAAYWFSLVTVQTPNLQVNFPEAKYDVAIDLKGPKGLVQTILNAAPQGALITTRAKNPEAVAKLMNWEFENIENHLTVLLGIKDKQWKWDDQEKQVVEVINSDYIGEFVMGQGIKNEVNIAFSSKALEFTYDYIRKFDQNFDIVKKPFDFGICYDTRIMSDKVPVLGDLQRMIDEGIAKFVTGARPISEYDKFIDELYKAGMDQWINNLTEQYNQLKK